MISFRLILFSALLLVAATVPVSAQRDQGGFIAPSDSLQQYLPVEKIIFLPGDGFTFYEFPNGEFKGKILPGPPHQPPPGSEADTLTSATVMGASIRPQLLTTDSFFETTNKRFHLSFSQQMDDHIFVLGESYKGWIPVSDILTKGFKLVYWMEFYGEKKGRVIHPIEKTAAIRMSPYADAPVIATADELYSEITTSGKCEGSFCNVKVTQYKNPYDATKSKEENVEKKYKGWIRIIDEEGKPMVAHYIESNID